MEYLIGYEGDAFASTGDIAADVLSIAAVHPLRSSAIDALLTRRGADWSVVERLIESGELNAVDYQGRRFYLRARRVAGAD